MKMQGSEAGAREPAPFRIHVATSNELIDYKAGLDLDSETALDACLHPDTFMADIGIDPLQTWLLDNISWKFGIFSIEPLPGSGLEHYRKIKLDGCTIEFKAPGPIRIALMWMGLNYHSENNEQPAHYRNWESIGVLASFELFEFNQSRTEVRARCYNRAIRFYYDSLLDEIAARFSRVLTEYDQIRAKFTVPDHKRGVVAPAGPVYPQKNADRDRLICELRYGKDIPYKQIASKIKEHGYSLSQERVEQICRMDPRYEPYGVNEKGKEMGENP